MFARWRADFLVFVLCVVTRIAALLVRCCLRYQRLRFVRACLLAGARVCVFAGARVAFSVFVGRALLYIVSKRHALLALECIARS